MSVHLRRINLIIYITVYIKSSRLFILESDFKNSLKVRPSLPPGIIGKLIVSLDTIAARSGHNLLPIAAASGHFLTPIAAASGHNLTPTAARSGQRFQHPPVPVLLCLKQDIWDFPDIVLFQDMW